MACFLHANASDDAANLTPGELGVVENVLFFVIFLVHATSIGSREFLQNSFDQ